MRALVWYGERDVRYEDAPDPEPADDEVVFDVELAGICGSDLHGYRGHSGPRVPPLVLGHEVGSVGGERFTIDPIVACGTCERCRAGEDNLCASWRLIGMHRPGVLAERLVLGAGPIGLLTAYLAARDGAHVIVVDPIPTRRENAYSRASFARAVAILAEGDLRLDWLSDAALSEGAEAFANLVDRPAEYAKVLLSPA
jgi:threonine dehydrogenase-like Zn-dependent dehydrogenase